MRAAGLSTRSYGISGRRTGVSAGPDRTTDRAQASHGWGFVLAHRGPRAPALGLSPRAPELRFLTDEVLAGASRDAERGRLPEQAPSTLVHPRYWEEP